MRTTATRIAIAAVAAVTLVACTPTDGDVEPGDIGTAEPSEDAAVDPAGTIHEDDAAAGDFDDTPGDELGEPEFDCREVEGEEICDTFDETDEGPGTTDEVDSDVDPDEPVSSNDN